MVLRSPLLPLLGGCLHRLAPCGGAAFTVALLVEVVLLISPLPLLVGATNSLLPVSRAACLVLHSCDLWVAVT